MSRRSSRGVVGILLVVTGMVIIVNDILDHVERHAPGLAPNGTERNSPSV